MKGKPLLPTLRTKKRYVAYEIISDQYTGQNAYAAIYESYKEYFGRVGVSKSGLMKTGIYANNKEVLKINNKFLDELRLAMSMIKEIDKKSVILHTLTVSGMINKAKTAIGG
ncbi:MAG: Rpp14/Pop5 family protein [archaeon]